MMVRPSLITTHKEYYDNGHQVAQICVNSIIISLKEENNENTHSR